MRDFREIKAASVPAASELECLVMLAGDLCFLPTEAAAALAMGTEEVKRMLGSFISKLTSDS